MTKPETSIPPRPATASISRLRRYFFTGLVIIAPAAITIWATLWFIERFDNIVKPLVPQAYNPDTYLPFKVPGFGLVVSIAVITLVGFLAANLVGRTLLRLWDKMLNSTPVVRSLYKGSKQIFETLFSDSGASFRQVCLVEWPRKGAWSPAFISREVDGAEVGLEAGRKMYALYVSTTPNPTSGYVFFADQSDVKILDMSVEDGLKLVISMGIIFPDGKSQVAAGATPPVKRKLSRKTKA
ncbi:DUF502 domain-containing protein [Aestuariivirga litoralis]|uniref:DUF502 domain-containing protein n=1 Tax=Aestuariivirga litoralis TaxID=2650924 RepID=UPI0018C53FEC|nr:DUF502 domain-containing protein [Aestuariivirga litoralis]MBG1231645.1 DUF502 domain-containing protein [Aestuariivirga litoralis]